jgi:hypothetical protein
MALDFPNNPSDGDTFGNYFYDASKGVWRIFPNVPGIISQFYVDATAPVNPRNGEIWLNSTDGNTYIYYDDGDSAQWIEIGGNTGFPPDLNTLSDVTITSPTTGEALVYDGSEWANASIATTLDSLTDTNIVTPTAGQALVYDGSDWVNASGNILQVLSTSLITPVAITSTSPQNVTGLSVTITPSSSSSKIFLLANLLVRTASGSYTNNRYNVTATSGTSPVSEDVRIEAPASQDTSVGFSFLHSPATTSAVTYQVVASSGSGTTTVSVNNLLSTLTAIEVAG